MRKRERAELSYALAKKRLRRIEHDMACVLSDALREPHTEDKRLNTVVNQRLAGAHDTLLLIVCEEDR